MSGPQGVAVGSIILFFYKFEIKYVYIPSTLWYKTENCMYTGSKSWSTATASSAGFLYSLELYLLYVREVCSTK